MLYTINMFSTNRKIALAGATDYDSIIKHSHSFVEIVYVEEGMAVHKIKDRSVEIQSGDLFIIDVGYEHFIIPVSKKNEFRIMNILVDPSIFSANGFFDPTDVFNKHKEQVGEIVNIIKDAYSKLKYSDSDLTNLVDAIVNICKFEKIEETMADTQKFKKKQDYYIDKASNYIFDNYSRKITVDEIAEYVGIYPTYLEKLFKEHTNNSIQNFLLTYRLKKSCQYLIEGDLSIDRVANLVGINDTKNFYTHFKTYFKTTPKKFREEYKKIEIA